MKKNAFVLSGGGSRGAYELGVWQGLRELGIPIHIAAGTSVGALNGAMVAQDDFELAVDLWKELETHMLFDLDEKEGTAAWGFDFEIGGMNAADALAYAREIVTKGGAGASGLEKIVKDYVDEEKIRKSSVQLGIVTVEFPSLKPYYLFTEDIPEGKLTDYILASAACFPAVQAKEISGTRFIDGGYKDVMPVELALRKGAERIFAVYLDAAGFVKKEDLKAAEETVDQVLVIESRWDLGNFLIFDTDNTRRIMRLGYLDTLKAFGIIDGEKFSFSKGTFSSHQLAGAEAAAELFKLDPGVLYTKEYFHEHLAKALSRTAPPQIRDIHTAEDALRRLNPRTLVLFIAESLREKDADSIFIGRGVFRLLKEEVLAANYLIQSGIFRGWTETVRKTHISP